MRRTPSSPQPFLTLREATFRLGDRLIFQDTSWRFARGEHWAVVGPNGSGKSLLATGLRGQLPLVHGEMRYHFRAGPGLNPEAFIGHVAFEGRKAELHGEVAQSRWNSFEEESALRVGDYLSYERVMDINPFEVSGRHERNRPQFARRRRQAVGLLQIQPFLGRTLLSLSNGERQRVELARALCHPLRLLVLDEPFVGLDAGAHAYFHRQLERLMETPLRILFLTTRAVEMPRHITHVLRVENCRIKWSGTRADYLARAAQSRSVIEDGVRLLHSRERLKSSRASSHRLTQRAVDGSRQSVLVELRDVSVRYGSKLVLRNINWSVRAGESWALLGPNGSGKTTLLSLLVGDHPQSYANDVVVLGRKRGTGGSIWDLKKRIGWISPELHLHFNDRASCFEVVASGFQETVGLFEPPTRRQRALARAWLKRFALLEFAASPLFALSAGLQRMVLLARALVKQPELLILDEPCQGLDAMHRELFIGTVDELIRGGAVTAIYVTHRLEEIPPSIKRVLGLDATGAAVRNQ